jgi:hypothetical protein
VAKAEDVADKCSGIGSGVENLTTSGFIFQLQVHSVILMVLHTYINICKDIYS